ncbi:uncharacterized protein LOC115435882 [Sphaeramia orbicularis]|nr:uncharacterized protein LOC115435882 [Sphaeramia orbicularis]
MAFLANGRGKETAGSQQLTSCLSNDRISTEMKKESMFSRTAVQRRSGSLREGTLGSASAAPSSFCTLTTRAQRRRRETEGMDQNRGEGAESHLITPQQLSLQVRTMNKVAMVTGLSEQRSSCVRSVSSSGAGRRQSSRPCTRPSSTDTPQDDGQRSLQETNNRHLTRPSTHHLPRNQGLPPIHRTVTNYYNNHKTLSSLQNSGRFSSMTLTQLPLTNGSVITQLSENPGVLRLSRRRRGLPPDTSPTTQNQVFDANSSKRKKALHLTDGNDTVKSAPHHVGQTAKKTANFNEDIKVEFVSHICKATVSHNEKQERSSHVGELKLESGSCIGEDPNGKINVGELCLESITALEPIQKRDSSTSKMTNCDHSSFTDVKCRPVRTKRLQRNQAASSTATRTITRTANPRTVARASTAKMTVTKAAVNSLVTKYVQADSPAICSAKPNKGKDNTKYISPANSYFTYNSKGSSKYSTNSTHEDLNKDSGHVSSCSSTSKGSTKGLVQTKSPTSALKTRTSPRMLLKN